MKITNKGQVTIPLPIRSELGLKSSTVVELLAEAGKAVLRARTTTAKIMKLTRAED